MRRVNQIMGMPITVDVPECDSETIFKALFKNFKVIDEQFSTYKTDSEVSRFRDGRLSEQQLSQSLNEVIKACREAEKLTDGYFSAWAGGSFDPSGYVKGWAIKKAGDLLENRGYRTYCIGAGGDILARSDKEKVWQIGIQDPREPNKILDKLSITNGAVATSGNYERGAHIIDPKTKQPVEDLLSVTVVGPDIIKADIFATAIFAMGKNKADKFINRNNDYKVLIVD